MCLHHSMDDRIEARYCPVARPRLWSPHGCGWWPAECRQLAGCRTQGWRQTPPGRSAALPGKVASGEVRAQTAATNSAVNIGPEPGAERPGGGLEWGFNRPLRPR